MMLWVYIAGAGLAAALFLMTFKSVELAWGMPRFYKVGRERLDNALTRMLLRLKLRLLDFVAEVHISVKRTPHMFIHLAMVMRDKLRVRFAHYIDEVKGRKKISHREEANSEFITAVKEHKDTNGGGQIE
jgi:hypothetical protein